jgi:hypothetical protein
MMGRVLIEGGKNIQQGSEFFASLWYPMLLPVLYINACTLFAHTRVRVSIIYSATF